MKICTDCKIEKPLDDFHRRSASKDGRQGRCKQCNVVVAQAWNKANPDRVNDRERQRGYHLSKHGFTIEEYDSLVVEMNNLCSICGEQMKRRHIDHDHATGAVRGIICDHCNRGLGAFRDSPEFMLRAIEYLANPPLNYLQKVSRYGTVGETANEWREGRNPRTLRPE